MRRNDPRGYLGLGRYSQSFWHHNVESEQGKQCSINEKDLKLF